MQYFIAIGHHLPGEKYVAEKERRKKKNNTKSVKTVSNNRLIAIIEFN
jgi:hypothetical protein